MTSTLHSVTSDIGNFLAKFNSLFFVSELQLTSVKVKDRVA